MQNIPGIALETATEQYKAGKFSSAKSSEQQTLFNELFDQHSTRMENELALKPVSTEDQMLESAPEIATETEAPVNAANTKAPVKEDPQHAVERDRDQKMTQEDLDQVRDDLEEYGMSEAEIAEIEEKVNSEEGMTWGEFVSTVAHKMKELRKVDLTDEQKENLNTFFSKFGFNEKESAKLIKQLEQGDTASVMEALQAKIDQMPDTKNLLFSKEELEAFSAAMNFSKEFTSKIKEAFGQNMMAKEVKEAFTMIRQEMADLDQKDVNLVRSIGKAFVAAMKENHKETTAAKDLNEQVDLKPRVAEDGPKVATKEDLKEAVEKRRDTQADTNVRTKTEQKSMPEQTKQEVMDQDAGQSESDETWNNFFGKLQENSTHKPAANFTGKTEGIESMLKTGLAEANANTQSKTQAWEKISAPKVMRQVENGFIKTLENGAKQLTLQLTPENLGKLNVMLQVNGKEVSATIRAENADAARVIMENIDVLKSSLENQGLKVDKLEVQTGLASDQSFDNWFGSNEHNLARDREAMVAMRNHMKQMREESSSLAQEMQNVHRQANHADQGLHVIA
ncbi:flagellar hook-length control protein FliK [Pseudodesulfovibrio sp. zrk46]|uniref:flagellar hook-length control protein FliK n=1 Tax=Pseudodesulfovibrio sp. zrk46 TaxID=2725288 RepID=UPI00144971C4|nr:flagellar hook-length control protein FliK [Pseudodesulfovibrio sp. zrk46]QJB56445.1 flagellar hook-length control protein FliK [Pseudodesulfovibrio sp. zrk46]